jgi:hypothetical protein
MVVHACNLSTQTSVPQKKTAWANTSEDPTLKIPNTKTGLAEWYK